MTRTARFADRKTKSLVVPIALQGVPFSFNLWTRPLDLGEYGTVQYYWMSSADFRVPRRKRAKDLANFRNCVGHWRQAMASRGLATDPLQVGHLLLATAFRLFAANKSLQKIYRDAHLKCKLTDPESMSLSDEIDKRIQAVVTSKNREEVRKELDCVLGEPRVQHDDMTLISNVFMRILGQGVVWYQEKGDDGFELFLGKLDAWCTKWRKESGQDWHQSLLNKFAYECKVSFYRCYSNSWIDLIPWLRKHRGLDELSERFLRMWHMQNQPQELPDGSVIPDVFGGQVLSLHPLSGFVMKDPAALAVAGKFLASPDYDTVMHNGRVESCQAYWDLIRTILTAAHLYRQTQGNQEQQRVCGNPKDVSQGIAQFSQEDHSPNMILEQFLVWAKNRCAGCGQDLSVKSFSQANVDLETFDVDCICSGCQLEMRLPVERRAFEEYVNSCPESASERGKRHAGYTAR